jgi:hypothetical protein
LKALVITPVKDSLDTVRETIKAIAKAKGDFTYLIYDDFSRKETRQFLDENKMNYNYQVIHLDEITNHPSPNYLLVLQHAQAKATEANVPLIIVESDVIIREDTFLELLKMHDRLPNPGLIGAITTDREGNYNFPYGGEKKTGKGIEVTRRSLSFCCTLISQSYLKTYDFRTLSEKKDWYDIFISRQARTLGFKNYISKRNEVLHLPHSSRPWKQLKYTHPIKYYFYKWIRKRDRI